MWHKQRGWGWYLTLFRGKKLCIKILRFKPAGKLSLQKHQHRSETWYILKGFGMMTKYPPYVNVVTFMQFLDTVYIAPDTWHQFYTVNMPCWILEIQRGDPVTEEDIERDTENKRIFLEQ